MSRTTPENDDMALREHLELLYQALIKVPRGMGDHTDLCRMHNQGLPPADDHLCRCHVGPVRAALVRYRSWKDKY
ncbi:MAG: hypothetical protein HQL83_03790 [Magnetococcales bacterium]|nr:hypothetical protein [Magnetococcales bacterium]